LDGHFWLVLVVVLVKAHGQYQVLQHHQHDAFSLFLAELCVRLFA
jgi:hypothetical protein